MAMLTFKSSQAAQRVGYAFYIRDSAKPKNWMLDGAIQCYGQFIGFVNVQSGCVISREFKRESRMEASGAPNSAVDHPKKAVQSIKFPCNSPKS